MTVVIQPSEIYGTLAAPPSKSAMQRACAAALLTGGITRIQNPGISNDDEAALDIIQQFGAVITRSNDEIIIDSTNNFLTDANDFKDQLQINCGESGLSIRMFTPIAALSKSFVSITGSGSLASRPMNFFNEVLPQLEVKISSQNGKIPLQVHGPLKPANIAIDGSLSSQFLTGLLMAYSAANAGDVTIEVIGLKSKPYIDLTLSVMKSFGLLIPVNDNYERFYFAESISNNHKQSIIFNVEGDWSGGAFLLVSGAINGCVVIKGLDIHSTQADKKIMQALKDSGASIEMQGNEIVIKKELLEPFIFDATDCPDLFPPLVALAAYCNGQSIIKGVSRLTHKESNRAITLQNQFGKLGLQITLAGDDMIINSNGKISGGTIHSCHDHRIAMACAVAAIGATGAVIIEDAEAINKSYPEFYKHLQQLNVQLHIDNN